MNLDLFKQELISKTANRFSWDDDSREDVAVLITEFRSRRYGGVPIGLRVTFDNEGSLFVTFEFSRVACSREILTLVNYFNKNVLFFKAYVDKRLCVEQVVPSCESIEGACAQVIEAISFVQSDRCAEYLCPLTEITEA